MNTIYKNDLELWSNLTFKTRCYRKNFDLTTENENIITEYEGSVSELNVFRKKPPFVIGEFGFSVWNIELGNLLGVDFNALIKSFSMEDTYNELMQTINNNELDITKYKKIVLLHSFIIRADYRKHGITEEFIEFIYRDFHNGTCAIIALVKPFQYNVIDCDYYLNHKSVQNMNIFGDFEKLEKIPANEYYSLDELYKKNDIESNEYRLFSVATKCGFSRIGESHLFRFLPEKIIERMLKKMNEFKKLNNPKNS